MEKARPEVLRNRSVLAPPKSSVISPHGACALVSNESPTPKSLAGRQQSPKRCHPTGIHLALAARRAARKPPQESLAPSLSSIEQAQRWLEGASLPTKQARRLAWRPLTLQREQLPWQLQAPSLQLGPPSPPRAPAIGSADGGMSVVQLVHGSGVVGDGREPTPSSWPSWPRRLPLPLLWPLRPAASKLRAPQRTRA